MSLGPWMDDATIPHGGRRFWAGCRGFFVFLRRCQAPAPCLAMASALNVQRQQAAVPGTPPSAGRRAAACRSVW